MVDRFLDIIKRITAKNADSIAWMESTGKIESSNAEAVVLTGGKQLNMTLSTRLNMTQTNAYVAVWNRIVGHQRLGKEYELTQMDLLGVFHTPLRDKKVAEIAHMQEMSRKRKSSVQERGPNNAREVSEKWLDHKMSQKFSPLLEQAFNVNQAHRKNRIVTLGGELSSGE